MNLSRPNKLLFQKNRKIGWFLGFKITHIKTFKNFSVAKKTINFMENIGKISLIGNAKLLTKSLIGDINFIFKRFIKKLNFLVGVYWTQAFNWLWSALRTKSMCQIWFFAVYNSSFCHYFYILHHGMIMILITMISIIFFKDFKLLPVNLLCSRFCSICFYIFIPPSSRK